MEDNTEILNLLEEVSRDMHVIRNDLGRKISMLEETINNVHKKLGIVVSVSQPVIQNSSIGLQIINVKVKDLKIVEKDKKGKIFGANAGVVGDVNKGEATSKVVRKDQ